MSTTILGANGKLGAILASFARRDGLGWQTQARSGAADVIWSGNFDVPAVDAIFKKGATLINMIGATRRDDPQLHETNAVFVQNLLEKAAQNSVAHVVLVSSAAIYGAGDERAFSEDDPPDPSTPYGASKAAMENIANTFAGDNGLAITILRIGNVTGADALMDSAKRYIAIGEPMPLHRFEGGAAATRSYIGPRDLFHVVRDLSAPHAGPARTVNVVHPQPVTLDAVLMAYKAHLMPELNWIDAAAPNGVQRSATLSSEKLQALVKLPVYDNPADALAVQFAEYRVL